MSHWSGTWLFPHVVKVNVSPKTRGCQTNQRITQSTFQSLNLYCMTCGRWKYFTAAMKTMLLSAKLYDGRKTSFTTICYCCSYSAANPVSSKVCSHTTKLHFQLCLHKEHISSQITFVFYISPKCLASTYLRCLYSPLLHLDSARHYVCLSVCKNYWTYYHETWRKDAIWLRKEVNNFWFRSISGGRSRIFFQFL